ncbi:MAG TPA: hypothetical protein VK169_16925 [Saprospiraceae bacterium]|nr:hypothetical protein [Saprospiraceae bacterium]
MITLKKIFLFIIILASHSIISQNVGIGVLNPNLNLDVLGSFRIKNQDANTTAGLWFDGSVSEPVRSFIGTYDDTHFGIYGNGGAAWNFLINNTNNNIGIGGVIPEYRLDVNGRMRIQYEGATTGIWFDGTSLPLRSFIGNINDDYIGIWGSGGVGWNFAMNVINKSIGIGTTSPTSSLDLNGTLRIRSNTPIKGSVLTSQDNSGNAEWVNPIVFRAESTLNNTNQSCPNTTWTKVLFNQSVVFNISNAYQANTSVFTAPTDGIYEFNASVSFSTFANKKQSIRYILRRNGVNNVIAQAHNKGIYVTSSLGYFSEPVMLSFDYNLENGDQVWVEVWMENYNNNPDFIEASNTSTWFSGQLVMKF